MLAAWRTSGLNLGAFCRREDLGYKRVRRWRKQLEASRRRGRTTAAGRRQRAAPALLPVHVVEPAPVAEARDFELELRGGLRLRVPAQFDEAALARLLRVVEARA